MLSPSLTESVEYQTVGKILALIVVGVEDAFCARTFKDPPKKEKITTKNNIVKFLILTMIFCNFFRNFF